MQTPDDTLNDVFMRDCRRAFRHIHGLSASEADGADRGITDPASLAMARKHRVAGLLLAGAEGSVPAAWRTLVYGQSSYTARCTEEAERIVASLRNALGRIVLLKGPGLASQAWPDPGLRSFDDLDFRCRRDDYDLLVRIMGELGYRPTLMEADGIRHYWHFGWGVTFRHASGLLVEVNHRVFPPFYPWIRSLDGDAFAPTEDLVLDQASVTVPAPALHLLLACLHALWHGGERMAWVIDIGGLLVRHPDAFHQADNLVPANSFLRRAFHTGCRVAEHLLGPEVVRAPLVESIEATAGLYIAQLTSGEPIEASGIRRLHHGLLRPVERSAYTLRQTLTPGDGDFRWVYLPPAWRWLYWGLRPVRILIHHGKGREQR